MENSEKCRHEIGCHECDNQITVLLLKIDKFLEKKSFTNLWDLCEELEHLRGWILEQWGVNKKEK